MISEVELRERLDRLRHAIPDGAAAWVSRHQYVFYLTGCLPLVDSKATLLITDDAVTALWPGAVPEAAPTWASSIAFDPWAIDESSFDAAAAGLVSSHGLAVRSIVVDGGFVPFFLEGCDLRNGDTIFAALVREKSDAEVEIITRNLDGNDNAFARIARELRPGVSDFEVLSSAMDEISQCAGTAVAYDGNVGLGRSGANPEAQPVGTKAGHGDSLFVDLYPIRHGYAGDSTRSFAVGEALAWASEAHSLVIRALEAAEAALCPGVAAGEIDRICRGTVEAGHPAGIAHHVGHGIGVFAQEPPYLVPRNSDTLKVGDVVAVEPGVYHPTEGGIRVEDVFVITKTGARRLTNAPRDLQVCGRGQS